MRRGGAHGSGARRGRVRAGGGGGGCVPARVRGRGRGVCHVCRGRGCPRDPGPPESGGRTAEGHAREPRPAPLYSHASRSCSWSPPAARPYCLSSASVVNTPSSKACRCRLCTPDACARCHTWKKKILLTSLFLTSAKILLLVPLAQFHSSNGGLACAFRRRVLPHPQPPAFD